MTRLEALRARYVAGEIDVDVFEAGCAALLRAGRDGELEPSSATPALRNLDGLADRVAMMRAEMRAMDAARAQRRREALVATITLVVVTVGTIVGAWLSLRGGP